MLRTIAGTRFTVPTRYKTTGQLSITDTFTRADSSSTLGTTETGGLTWQSLNSGVYGISSNQAYYPGSPYDSPAYIDAGISNIDMSVTIATYDGGAREDGIYFRIVDSNNWWRLVRSGGSLLLQKHVAGSNTTVYNISPTFANGDIYRVVCNGNQIIIYLNGKPIMQTTDSFNATATKHGFGNATASSGARWDNFVLLSLDGI